MSAGGKREVRTARGEVGELSDVQTSSRRHQLQPRTTRGGTPRGNWEVGRSDSVGCQHCGDVPWTF